MKIKLCGFKETHSLAGALAYQPDYIGFIFYPPSQRYITPQAAKNLIKQQKSSTTPSRPQWIGVFVNASLATILTTIAKVGLDGVQLHGTETPEFIKTLRSTQKQLIIWKAFRLKDKNSFQTIQYTYKTLLAQPGILDAILLDSYHPKHLGGSGSAFPPQLLNPWLASQHNIVLAGGIHIANLASFINHPPPVTTLDVSSALEENKVKSLAKINRFMTKFKYLQAHPTAIKA